MVETKTETGKKEVAKTDVSVAKNKTTAQKKLNVKKGGKKLEGRNADGTFKKGHTPKITENYGRPQTDFSHRAMAKARAAKDPKRIQKDLDKLDEIIDSDDSSPADKMRAIEMKIKLNQGYDATETKDVTPKVPVESPLNGLTIEELRTLKALKGKKK